ncbi:TPA: prepilin peptidase [Candidatus Avigastranaerophilus faecigallinarum]|nr:prepilin peptidase [Candidatus Avigastranaerophilus faecigallinarum]
MIDELLLICFFVLITGACIGSFLNVVALRAISKESIVFPSSKCPLCNEPIKWYDNIPVISYFFTFKGKCRNCGEKVSIQYPIVEALTAILFLAVFLTYGLTLKTLFLLILLSISIVIMITDIKKEYVFDIHSWILIVFAIITSLVINGLDNYAATAIGLIVGVFVMEIIARLSYYLVRKKQDNSQTQEASENQEKNEETSNQDEDKKAKEALVAEESQSNEEENVDINDYVNKNKRAFGEGDTYLAAAAGALLGWKYFLVAVAFAIIIQAVCILPQFLFGLYKKEEYKLLTSLTSFIVLAIMYWILSNLITLPLLVVFAFVIALIFFAIDSITRLKKTVNEQGFVAIPFGPALLCSMFIVFFWGTYIVQFLKKYIFMISG